MRKSILAVLFVLLVGVCSGATTVTLSGNRLKVTSTAETSLTINQPTGNYMAYEASSGTLQVGSGGSAKFQVGADGTTTAPRVNLTTASAHVVGGDTVTTNGGLRFGSDVNLYRSAANALKTDDALQVGSNFVAAGFASTASTMYAQKYWPYTAAADFISQLRNDSYFFKFQNTAGTTIASISAAGDMMTTGNLSVGTGILYLTSIAGTATISAYGPNVTGVQVLYATGVYATGDVSAATFTDRTEGYPLSDDTALSEISNISNTTTGEINHDTLPTSVTVIVKDTYKNVIRKPSDEVFVGGIVKEVTELEPIVKGAVYNDAGVMTEAGKTFRVQRVKTVEKRRDLGMMISAQCQAIRALKKKLEKQQVTIDDLTSRVLKLESR